MMKRLALLALVLAQPAFAQTLPVGTDQAPGSAAPPAIAHDRAADRYFDSKAMAAAAMETAPRYGQIRMDIAEYQSGKDRDGYRWEGEAWTGDLNRLILRGKGEGSFGQRIDHAEVQGLYSRALDPWWNVQMGVRQDIGAVPARSYATIGIEGLAPYKFDVLAAAYVSDKGQLTGRVEATFDERLTRRLVLRPRVEFDFSAQDMRWQRLGAGLNNVEVGLRLYYEIRRELAPYVGLSYNLATGQSVDYSHQYGESAQKLAVVAGVKSWF